MILLNYQVFLDAVVLAMACVARSERKEIVSFIIYTLEYSKFQKKINLDIISRRDLKFLVLEQIMKNLVSAMKI